MKRDSILQALTPGIVLVSVFLAGCTSSSTNNQATSNGKCSEEQKTSVTNHISAQISAFEQKNWDEAYGFASGSFQESISKSAFQEIIMRQYSFIVDNSGYSFGSCSAKEDGVLQNVTINSGSQTYELIYNLILEDGSLGIDAAKILTASENVAT